MTDAGKRVAEGGEGYKTTVSSVDTEKLFTEKVSSKNVPSSMALKINRRRKNRKNTISEMEQ